MAKFKEGISDQLRADHTYQTLKEADKHCTMPQRGKPILPLKQNSNITATLPRAIV
jgi:hypothetical protein